MTDQSDTFLAEDERKTLIKLYVLYFFGFLTVVTGIIGIVMIYRRMNEARPSKAMFSHFLYMIRTFWAVTVLGGGAFVFMFATGSILLNIVFYLVVIWGVLRCAKGAILATSGRAVPNPQTWLLPRS